MAADVLSPHSVSQFSQKQMPYGLLGFFSSDLLITQIPLNIRVKNCPGGHRREIKYVYCNMKPFSRMEAIYMCFHFSKNSGIFLLKLGGIAGVDSQIADQYLQFLCFGTVGMHLRILNNSAASG